MRRHHSMLILATAVLTAIWAFGPMATVSPVSESNPADSQARERLESLSGCFSVRYQFVEDGSERDFFSPETIEYMDVRSNGDGYWVRNFLILDDYPSFLHWTQDWSPVGHGAWRMKVAAGDESVRYEMTGRWQFNQWEGDPAPAVKPTRDQPRTDYDTLQRRNAMQFTDKGWIQSEVNVKLRHDGTPVANELGWIVYTRLPNEDACAEAIKAAGARDGHTDATGHSLMASLFL